MALPSRIILKLIDLCHLHPLQLSELYFIVIVMTFDDLLFMVQSDDTFEM